MEVQKAEEECKKVEQVLRETKVTPIYGTYVNYTSLSLKPTLFHASLFL